MLARTALVALVALAAAAPALAQDAPAELAPFIGSDLYIVRFQEPSLARYTGGVPGLPATNPAARGQRKLDPRSQDSRAYLAYLEALQADRVAALQRELQRPLEVRFQYLAVYNGLAAAMSPEEAAQVAALPWVRSVTPDWHYPLATDRGPIFIGAPGIWDGSATGGAGSSMGEGVVVGVIDTGVNLDHPSFAATGGDGFTHTNPLGAGVFIGECDATFICNDKLFGAWDFADGFGSPPEADGPEDDNGHGSHTASTAAGNVLMSPPIAGVAPHANLITYDSCYTNAAGQGACPFAATSAAVNQAVLDGVDAINYSITGGTSPWGGDIDTFFLDAVAAGTFVSASAANTGPTPSTVNHLGPWVATIGASTHDRVTYENEIINMTGGGSPPGDLTGASMTAGYGPAAIVYAGDFSNGDPNPEQCLNPFPPGSWTSGEIVLCDRGSIARVLKCAHVADGGAGGCVLGNVSGGATTVVADPHVIPAIHVDLASADSLRTWLAGGSGHMATLTAGTVILDPGAADIMAGFSARGPNLAFDALKPDLTNPGVNILAAFNSGGGLPPPEFGVISGTSMSSPHTAGSGALLRGLHPGWTPMEIKSALMTTSDTTVLKETGLPADPFDYGAGRVELTRAGRAGLLMDETEANFDAADPAMGGDPKTLNVASMQDSACLGLCTWLRRVRNPTASNVTWTASGAGPSGLEVTTWPGRFTIGPGETRTVKFVAGALTGFPLGNWAFGEVTLTPDDAGIPESHFPVAVIPSGNVAEVPIFSDGFESGDVSVWADCVGGGCP